MDPVRRPRGRPRKPVLPEPAALGPRRGLHDQATERLRAWIVEGTLPATADPSYGVLVVEKGTSAVQGVLLYEGLIVEGAPRLGFVSVGAGARTLPLIGVELDMSGVQDARCPIFPDSLRQ